MSKPGIIFAFVSIYAIAAFSWWTIAHIRDSNRIYEKGKENLELMCYKATNDVSGAINQQLFNDTNGVKEYVRFNFPGLEIVFIEPEKQINPMDYYLIRPQKLAYDTIEQRRIRTVYMYGAEGLVMLLLLMWGIIWIYRSLYARLDLNRQQNNFMLSITHELKTPLASAKLYIETLLKRDLDREQSKQILTNSHSELVRLKDLVNNILMAAQLENHHYRLMKTEINLTQVCKEVFDKFTQPRNLSERFVFQSEEDVFIEADSLAIETIVSNLISNAYKYGGENGKVKLSIVKQEKGIVLSVADEGQGINEEDKRHLFKRFYRSGNEETRKSKGTGLGLFIVKNLLNLMDADISVRNNQPQGTIFEITFKPYHAI